MLRQISRLLAGQPLLPFAYRDFGSLVSLGQYRTFGDLNGLFGGKGLFIEGYVARLMYRSLYIMHEVALNGSWRTLLETLARRLSRRSRPLVKLH